MDPWLNSKFGLAFPWWNFHSRHHGDLLRLIDGNRYFTLLGHSRANNVGVSTGWMKRHNLDTPPEGHKHSEGLKNARSFETRGTSKNQMDPVGAT